MDKNSAKAKLREAIINAIQRTGRRGFRLSQDGCPVDTGELKKSGSDKDLDNGIEINYSAEYAAEVERGTRPGNRNVRAHTRKGHPVKGYTYYSKGNKANPFIEKALTTAFTGFSKEFDDSLKTSFSGEAKIEKLF